MDGWLGGWLVTCFTAPALCGHWTGWRGRGVVQTAAAATYWAVCVWGSIGGIGDEWWWWWWYRCNKVLGCVVFRRHITSLAVSGVSGVAGEDWTGRQRLVIDPKPNGTGMKCTPARDSPVTRPVTRS
ncbi:hypothetical protein EDC01DRAFT_681510 [Geopyxis carbonaria]|nr:hypothetical protein EDC01DRAFT_681510 [Geopyxis carbonaria]